MPERPKRRKNKNKRKNNKNVNNGDSKNNVIESDNKFDEPSCSAVDNNEEKENISNVLPTDNLNQIPVVNESSIKESDIKKCETTSQSSENVYHESLNQSSSNLQQNEEINDITKIIEETSVLNNKNLDIGTINVHKNSQCEVIRSTSELCQTSKTLLTTDDSSSLPENEELNEEITDEEFVVVINNTTDTDDIGKHRKVQSEVIPAVAQLCETSDQLSTNKDDLISDQFKSLNDEKTDQSSQFELNKLNSRKDDIVPTKPLNDTRINEQAEGISQKYIVETPEQITRVKCKLDNGMKSKSCDNDDCPTITEITDDSSDTNDNIPLVDNSSAIITAEESDIEWEKVDHFNLPETELIKSISSSDTIPLNIVHCEQITSLSPQDEVSLRNYLQTLNLSTSPSNLSTEDIKTEIEQIINREVKYRLRKKGLTEDYIFNRAGPSRSLAVIDEEGSGDSSRRHSYLSDKKSDNEELEDDVFESSVSNTFKSKNTDCMKHNSMKRVIPQACIRVDAKLKEPEISEARGDWSVKMVEKMTGAELVYLTDSSSSTSSIYDVNDDNDKGDETDVSVRMITPTIEVTDTESLLCNTFLSDKNDKAIERDSSENKDDQDKIDTLIDDTSPNLNDSASNEIVILRTDNIQTNLIVKDICDSKSSADTENKSENDNNLSNNCGEIQHCLAKSPKAIDIYDLEIKVLKCELNDAINNLIKEVISDSENNAESREDTLIRQDSSSSVNSSQCTAKYNPTHSSLNDVSNDDTIDIENKQFSQKDISSHVKDVIERVTSKPPIITKKTNEEYCEQPSNLRDICLKKITTFPFGDKILEELAQVSLRLQNMSALASECSLSNNKYPASHDSPIDSEKIEFHKLSQRKKLHNTDSVPPPILPRKSSLKVVKDESSKFTTQKTETVYECLSPSQKMLMEKTNTVIGRDFRSQPNISTIYDDSGYNSDKIQNNLKTSVIPMKSETGSRLLALLRDTSISNNINKQTSENKDEPLKKLQSDTFSKRLIDEIDSTKESRHTTTEQNSFSRYQSNNFKPIPPPKPKKLSNYFYESDSDYRESSFQEMRTSKKYFHYSTGNLNEEIENDISSIQNMHKYCTNLRDRGDPTPRRPSLPKDLCDQQMEYIRQKEKEVDAELRRLEQENRKPHKSIGPRAPMLSEEQDNCIRFNTESGPKNNFKNKNFTSLYQTSKAVGNNKLSSLFSSSEEELLREKMYSEYVNQMAEREQRKQQRVIKITQTPISSNIISKSMPLLENLDSKVNNRIEQEFISKARERWYKLGIKDPETEDERDNSVNLYREPKIVEHKIKVIEAGEEKDVKKLPSHMQEFVKFRVNDKEEEAGSTGESDSEKVSAHVEVFCAVVILVLTVGKFLLQLLRNK